MQEEPRPYKCTLKRKNSQSMFCNPINTTELKELSRKLKNKNSSGDDDIPTSLVKDSIDAILEPLTYILNNSVKYGIFPKSLKLALVKPVFKKGDRGSLGNYRSISLLSSFSKIFEIAMGERLINFLTKSNILSGNQHGFIKGKSTNTAIFQYIGKILECMEEKMNILGLFFDLSKAYDSVDHEILLEMMEQYGIRGQVLKWFRSYLTHREQRVLIVEKGEEIKSDKNYIKQGIPQGSILGCILFLLYINDLTGITDLGELMVLFADDTNVLLWDENFQKLLINTTNIFGKMEEWLKSHKLKLNTQKTSIMSFRTHHSRQNIPEEIQINESTFKLQKTTKFLGITLDEHLTWKEHIESVNCNLNSVCYTIRVLSKYLSRPSLRTIYFANFESRMRYGIIFYGSNRNINNIFTTQKGVLRIIFGLKYRESCRGLFRNNNILTTHAVYIQECLSFFFQNKHLFANNINPSINASRNPHYIYPKHHLTITEKNCHYSCLSIFNRLPIHMRKETNFKKYKKAIYEMLIKLEPYDMNEFNNM